ncbi:uncharacterized protein ISCGN_007565 [Ixodes scapularis]
MDPLKTSQTMALTPTLKQLRSHKKRPPKKKDFVDFLAEARTAIWNFFLIITENHKLAHTVAEKVFSDLQIVFEHVTRGFADEIAAKVDLSALPPDVLPLLRCSFVPELSEGIQSKHLREQYVKAHAPHVEPRTCDLGSEGDSHQLKELSLDAQLMAPSGKPVDQSSLPPSVQEVLALNARQVSHAAVDHREYWCGDILVKAAQDVEPEFCGVKALSGHLKLVDTDDDQTLYCALDLYNDTKYDHDVVALPQSTAAIIRDVLRAPPADVPYDKLKSELIRRASKSEQRRIQQLVTTEELSNRKPSDNLRKMQQLLGDKMLKPWTQQSFGSSFFVQRLPEQVRMILATSSEPIETLARMAEKVMDISTTGVYTARQHTAVAGPSGHGSNPKEQLSSLINMSERLSATVERLSCEIQDLQRSRPAATRPCDRV